MARRQDKLTIAEYNRIKEQLKGNPDMQFALMIDNYGPFKKGKSYVQQQEGYDWVLLQNRGKLYYVGKWLIHDDPFSVLLNAPREEPEDEEEDWDLDFFDY